MQKFIYGRCLHFSIRFDPINLSRERRRSLVKQYLDMLIPMYPKITSGLATKFSPKIDSQKVEIFEQKLKAADHHVEALWLRLEGLQLKRTLEETRQDLNCLKSDDTNPITGTGFVLPKRGQQSTETKRGESKNQPDAPERSCSTSCQRNTSLETPFQIDTTTTLSCEKPFFVTKETSLPLVNKDTTTDKNSENISCKNQTTVQIKVTEYEEYLLRAAPLDPDVVCSSGEQTDELELGEAIEQRKPTDEQGAVSNPVPSDFSQMPPMQNTASVPSATQKSDSDEDSFYD
ncbi:hypothetical protein P879_08093 [Paragonimus westermani]|uniref:Uncharacterized protein n=1 Tax=Paragonimus westermani TaxID=34504 RepID=A0A8T0DCZ7_9TREM|nr:hypothetical protein P879_08093 [Paragonimus westermani]